MYWSLTGEFSAGTRAGMGMNSYLAAATVETIDPDFLIRCYKWWEKVVASSNALGAGSFVLLEIMQKVPPPSRPFMFGHVDKANLYM